MSAPARPTTEYLAGYAAAMADPGADFTHLDEAVAGAGDRQASAWWAGYADGLEEGRLAARIAPDTGTRRRVRPGSVVWWLWQVALPVGLLAWGAAMSLALMAWFARGV